MSYEGYVQYLCESGHLGTRDCYAVVCFKCKRWKCNKPIIWENHVDITNAGDKGWKSGEIKLKIKYRKKCLICNSVVETVYVIPNKGRIK